VGTAVRGSGGVARQEAGADGRVARKKTTSVSVPEIAATLQVPEAVVRSYLATQTFRSVRLTFTETQQSRRKVRQWRQRPLKGM
jgi:hypothetical protein